ncbi:hypothetical protein E4T50_13111 [Aureobasidium sp. EXF-12298]|nr:hypothetical protein E4T50_13111 [Aureobasidium sp. EXF-12298]
MTVYSFYIFDRHRASALSNDHVPGVNPKALSNEDDAKLIFGAIFSLRRMIWANLYVEYVVKSPISPVEHTGGVGVANELFEGALESFINTVFPPS